MKPLLRAFAFLLAAALLAVADDSPAPVVILSPPTAAQPIKNWMKALKWAEKHGSAKKWMVEEGALHLISDGDSVLVGTEEKFPLDPAKTPVLLFECKVVSIPTGTDLTKKSGDDCAFRVYVAFDHGGSFLGMPDMIAYAWSENEAVDSVVQSGHFDNLKYIPFEKGKTRLCEWITVERNVATDYARAFGVAIDKVPKIAAIALKIDSNNLKGKAESFVRRVEFRAAAGK